MLQIKDFQTALKLYDLLQEKYGEQQVEFGLKLLAQWLQLSQLKQPVTAAKLKQLVLLPKSEEKPKLPADLIKELCKYFGLKNVKELYNNTVK